MTLSDTAVDELFGLAGSLPRPGWVVLDAAREERFTGELWFGTDPVARAYFDRGRIYYAELQTDPPVGRRLIEARVLGDDELRAGAVTVGDREHLGRLFERVPTVDADGVRVALAVLTDECTRWLANQLVHGAVATAYQHHPTGIHLLVGDDDEPTPAPPLPAPPPGSRPVEVDPPTGELSLSELLSEVGSFDELISWGESSWFDPDRPVASESRSSPTGLFELRDDARAADGITFDLGLPGESADIPPDPLTNSEEPIAPVPPADRFEVIWPSGEVDDRRGDAVRPRSDDDRVGPTTRVAGPFGRRRSDRAAGHHEPRPTARRSDVAPSVGGRVRAEEPGGSGSGGSGSGGSASGGSASGVEEPHRSVVDREHSAGGHPAGEHATGMPTGGEHPAGGHPAGEHPTGEDPVAEHPGGDAGRPAPPAFPPPVDAAPHQPGAGSAETPLESRAEVASGPVPAARHADGPPGGIERRAVRGQMIRSQRSVFEDDLVIPVGGSASPIPAAPLPPPPVLDGGHTARAPMDRDGEPANGEDRASGLQRLINSLRHR